MRDFKFRPQFSPNPKVRAPLGDDTPFDWAVGEEYARCGELYFFCGNTLPVLRGWERKKISWKELEKVRHCHYFNALFVKKPHRDIFAKVCKRIKLDPDSFFQIPGGASPAHRIIGYRKNGIFYLVYDDKDHSLLPSNG
jgi:hypothetical protein